MVEFKLQWIILQQQQQILKQQQEHQVQKLVKKFCIFNNIKRVTLTIFKVSAYFLQQLICEKYTQTSLSLSPIQNMDPITDGWIALEKLELWCDALKTQLNLDLAAKRRCQFTTRLIFFVREKSFSFQKQDWLPRVRRP